MLADLYDVDELPEDAYPLTYKIIGKYKLQDPIEGLYERTTGLTNKILK